MCQRWICSIRIKNGRTHTHNPSFAHNKRKGLLQPQRLHSQPFSLKPHTRALIYECWISFGTSTAFQLMQNKVKSRRADQVVQWVKSLAAKPDAQSWSPRTYMAEEENRFLQVVR